MMDLFEMAPTFDDPIGMLRACHRRIEQALESIGKVAECEQAGPLDEATRAGLRQILHYFNTGVPRHAADEEESLFPRLRAAVEKSRTAPGECATEEATAVLAGGPVLPALEAVEQEHDVAEAAHRELDTLGQVLLENGRFEDSADRARFNALVAELQHLYRLHIRFEDEELFPLAEKVVDSAEQDTIGTEMASRRGIDRLRHRELVTALESQPWAGRRREEGKR